MEFCSSPRFPCLVIDDHPRSAFGGRFQHLNAWLLGTASESGGLVAMSGYLGGGGSSEFAAWVAGVGGRGCLDQTRLVCVSVLPQLEQPIGHEGRQFRRYRIADHSGDGVHTIAVEHVILRKRLKNRTFAKRNAPDLSFVVMSKSTVRNAMKSGGHCRCWTFRMAFGCRRPQILFCPLLRVVCGTPTIGRRTGIRQTPS